PLIGHAIYRRVVTVRSAGLPFRDQPWGRHILSALLGLLLLYLVFRHGIISLLLVVFIVPAIGVLSFLMLPVMLPPLTALAAGFWAARISSTLVREYHTHTYELLCLAPNGSLGANWVIASGCLHRGDYFSALRFAMYVALLIGGMFLGLLAMVAVFMALRATPSQSLVVALRTVVDLSVILLLFYLHYVQSLVLSALVGVYVPTVFRSRMDATWVALALFVALQLALYAIFYGSHLLLAPLLATIPPTDWLAFVSTPLLYLILFLLPREVIILWLWGVVTTRLNATSSEQEGLLRAAG
ncbi:MAG: hypothetical protein K8J31_12495, partial [Anaerolineae bacterium]|nr:hypothetical protein [Anaerolineae bacterium]